MIFEEDLKEIEAFAKPEHEVKPHQREMTCKSRGEEIMFLIAEYRKLKNTRCDAAGHDPEGHVDMSKVKTDTKERKISGITIETPIRILRAIHPACLICAEEDQTRLMTFTIKEMFGRRQIVAPAFICHTCMNQLSKAVNG